MANVKDLFSNYRSQKVLSSASLNDLEPQLESANWIKSTVEYQQETDPYVDFASASNFVFYGSAEQYYKDAFAYIQNEYPYDGSSKEKIDWELTASAFDKYIYNKEYPRTNGYVTLGYSYGTPTANTTGYGSAASSEYIFFKGGPNAPDNSGSMKLSALMTSSNVYATGTNQQSNLEIDGDRGITLEFWLHKQSFNAANESPRQIICDVWNSASWGVGDYGRFRVEVSGASTTMNPNFYVELLSGTAGLSSGQTSSASPTTIMSASTITGSSWNHFALSFINDGSQMTSKLYKNGSLEYTLTTGSSIGLVTGSMLGQIGSLMTSVSGNLGAQASGTLSASLDEFRFWKTKRTSEQIGQHWFTQVNGGTNTDYTKDYGAGTKYSYSNPVDLGVYFKFNEGVTGIDNTDAKVLDYSGRVSNGAWTGYISGARSTGSAIVSASAALSEYEDPILYSYHPEVASKFIDLKLSGSNYDINNNASIYQSLPDWIRDQDAVNERNVLLKLTQIMASYFDNLQLQVKRLPRLRDVEYISSSYKPIPFANRLIDSTGISSAELFADAKAFEYLASRDDFRVFSEKLSEVKSRIYQNIYNNLVYIFKSKGTQKSFRNLIRCYGIGDELVKLNMYGDQITSIIRENFESTVTRKRYANFYQTGSFSATVYQSSSTTDTDARNYLSSSADVAYRGNTFEAEVLFPKVLDHNNISFINVPFVSSSLFGVHTVDLTTPTHDQWAALDVANFQVHAVRSPGQDDKDVYFVLTSSAGGVIPTLTSSIMKDAYDGTRWNLAVRIKPASYPWASSVGATTSPNYDVEFLGYNAVLDSIDNQFKATGSISSANGNSFLTSSKRAFIGAHRTNFTGTVLQKSDARISSVKYWYDYLDDETILAHAKDPSIFGTKHPDRNAYLTQVGESYATDITQVPQIETLALHWNFDQVTSSNASGEFVVGDYSSGSLATTSLYDWIGPLTNFQHPGKGTGFVASNLDTAVREYIHTAKQLPPEALNSSDMIEVKSEEEIEISTRETRPVKYFFAVEKSMYSVVSEEMIKLFATVMDFNNLIGEPVNRYRQDYKGLEKLRQLFFDRVQNDTVDFEKFTDYFKWVDDSIMKMTAQLFPASANYSDKIFNVLESHVLERNKYWTKFPTLEMNTPDPEAGARGINEMLYPYKRGRAPIPNTLTGSNCEWWFERVERSNSNITSGDSTVDSQRNKFKFANDFRSGSGPTLAISRASTAVTTTYEGGAYALRNFTKPYRFAVQEMPEIHGGSNFPRAKTVEYTHESLKFGGSDQLQIAAADIAYEKDCNDTIDPNAKERLEYKFKNTGDTDGYTTGKGTLLAPFSLFSSSVATGYVSDVATNFKTKTEIANYHDDLYGDDKGKPIQGPFTERHVGGRQHRHANINTASTDTNLTRAEAWNLSLASNTLTITKRSTIEPRATYVRDEFAKRPLNIRNIKWGTSSQAAGNYRKDYETIQTSGRRLNNRFFVKAGGFTPTTASSTFISGVIDFALPRYDLTGANKSIIVERFSAPGGPEVMSRGALDLYAEEYSVYNELNQRNSIVRNALRNWQTEHAGQFGIDPTGSPGDGTTPEEHAVKSDGYTGTIAAYHKVNRNPWKVPAEGVSTCSINYDNWFIQHPIPQSDYQYAWITASAITSACNSLFGHEGSPDGGRTNFTVPNSTTSTISSGPSFATASSTGAHGISADFVGLNTLILDPVITGSVVNLLSSSDGNYINTSIVSLTTEDSYNSLFLHRNGPYQYPSWKQIRTGENAIARYQKRKNIISVGPSRIVLKENSGSTRTHSEADVRGSLTHYTESPISYNKPLETTLFDSSADKEFTVRHSFANNLGFFTNDALTIDFGLPAQANSSDATGVKREKQMHDRLAEQYKNNPELLKNITYSEVVFPRKVNTSLAKSRGRTVYAETASLDSSNSASLSNGDNGIDKGPLYRRTFWRDSEILRNRREGYTVGSISWYSASSVAMGYAITGTLPNSQGCLDGQATSIYGMGRTPICYSFQPGFTVKTQNFLTYAESYILPRTDASGEPLAGVPVGVLPPTTFPDTGELNSANYQTIAGYFGVAVSSSNPNFYIGSSSTWFPTASAQYYHYPQTTWKIGGYTWALTRPIPWRVAELSGKSPWFDSYEEYAKDIRCIAKNFTVLPEFRMSEHMPYYADKDFRKNNDKFLSLDGAVITSSAVTESSTMKRTGAPRSGFNDNFFKEYSNTDFQKHFGELKINSLSTSNITLKCSAVKKLLPYHGFYPMHRTLQLASLFSQSIAPYIDGISWSVGAMKLGAEGPPSGALAVQSLLQPYYAPGIMYNTIKSGIAVDWGAMTGSNIASAISGGAISGNLNYRVPFESIFDPLSNRGLPMESTEWGTLSVTESAGKNKMFLLYPTYQYGGNSSSVALDLWSGVARNPYVSIGNKPRIKARSSKNYFLYNRAVNNFFAEVPNFFLEEQKLVSIISKQQGEISLIPGNRYFMDVVLKKNMRNFCMMQYGGLGDGVEEDPEQYGGINYMGGMPFGPPLRDDTLNESVGDKFAGNLPRGISFAPYAPSYYFGESIATLEYLAVEGDAAASGFSFQNFFNNVTMSFSSPQRDGQFALFTGSEGGGAPASASAMQITSSINMFGLFREPETTFDATTGEPIEVSTKLESGRNQWVISPKMETPVLNFANQPLKQSLGGEIFGMFWRGMWSGYGEFLESDNDGITLNIEETFKSEPSSSAPTNTRKLTGSLLSEFYKGFETDIDKTTRPIGRIASAKIISEAVIAIPFSLNSVRRSKTNATTVSIIEKNFFEIKRKIFKKYQKEFVRSGKAEGDTSIATMIERMNKYIIPPELDFITYEDINPFVMYIFEFNHKLSKQDLADIWQGVMPDISRVAELSNSDIDNNEFSHPTGQQEFFHGKEIPCDIRWMVFKVKRKANKNYSDITADITDDPRFTGKNVYSVYDKEVPYSYNWPYDYFSLVELATIDTEIELSQKSDKDKE